MPFSPEQLANIKIVVTHENCQDGMASALLLKDALRDRPVDIRFVQHGTVALAELKAEPGMLFCDFAPPAERAQEFLEAGALILDHHRTARAVVESFGANGIFADEKANPGVCGAVLAYEHVWKPLNPEPVSHEAAWIENFARLAGIRDTWQRQSPDWEKACAQAELLFFMGPDRLLAGTLSGLAAKWATDFTWIGDVLMERNARSVQKGIKGAFRFKTGNGLRVIMFEGVSKSSDTAEAVGSEFDLVIGFGYVCDDPARPPKLILSTRSHTDFDCAAFVSRFGGGGHTKAAGCTIEAEPLEATPNPYKLVMDLLDLHERG
jgi:hypothetical protein